MRVRSKEKSTISGLNSLSLSLSHCSNHREEIPSNDNLTSTSEESGRHEDSANFPSKPDSSHTPPAPKKSSQPSKLVDLGAAAAFASQAAADTQRKQGPANASTIDTVFGDFSTQPAPLPQSSGVGAAPGLH